MPTTTTRTNLITHTATLPTAEVRRLLAAAVVPHPQQLADFAHTIELTQDAGATTVVVAVNLDRPTLAAAAAAAAAARPVQAEGLPNPSRVGVTAGVGGASSYTPTTPERPMPGFARPPHADGNVQNTSQAYTAAIVAATERGKARDRQDIRQAYAPAADLPHPAGDNYADFVATTTTTTAAAAERGVAERAHVPSPAMAQAYTPAADMPHSCGDNYTNYITDTERARTGTAYVPVMAGDALIGGNTSGLSPAERSQHFPGPEPHPFTPPPEVFWDTVRCRFWDAHAHAYVDSAGALHSEWLPHRAAFPRMTQAQAPIPLGYYWDPMRAQFYTLRTPREYLEHGHPFYFVYLDRRDEFPTEPNIPPQTNPQDPTARRKS